MAQSVDRLRRKSSSSIGERPHFRLFLKEAPTRILDLPKEIVFHVFAFLDAHFLVTKVALVCKAWRDLVREDAFWRCLRALSLEVERGGAPFVERVIGKCPNLRYLKVTGSHSNETLFPISIPVGSLPHLQTLCFSYVSQSCEDALRHVLVGSPHLTSLSLVDNYKPLSDSVVDLIARVRDLTSLEISMLYVVGEARLVRLFGQCRRLRRVHLSIPERLDDAVVESVLTNCSATLASLTLFNSFSETAFRRVVHCAKLTELKVGCAELTDRSLRLLTALPSLHTLSLEDGKLFTTRGLRTLFGGTALPNLKHLELIECCRFEDSALDAVTSRYGQSLESLSLGYCARVTLKGIEHVMVRCSRLQVLRLSGLSVDYSFLKRLHDYLPRLRLLALLDRTVDAEDVRLFVERHPVFRARRCREFNDPGFYALYARCLDPRDLRPIVLYMNNNCVISALAHSSCV